MCKHRALSSVSHPGACVTCHYQGPVIPGQLPPGEPGTPQAVATSSWPLPLQAHHAFHPSPSPPSLSEPEPPNHCSCNLLLSGGRTEARGQSRCRGRVRFKPETQELCEQRREKEISPCNLRSSRLNLHNQLEVPCTCVITE